MPILINRKKLHPYVPAAERELAEPERSTILLRVLDPVVAAETRQRLIPYTAAFAAPVGGDDQAAGDDDRGASVLAAMQSGRFNLAGFVRDAVEVCADGIGGWANVRDEEGKTVEFATNGDGRVRRDLLLMFEAEFLQEVALEIMRLNTVGRDDRAKS